MYTCMYTYICIEREREKRQCIHNMYVYVYIYIYIYIYTHIYIHIDSLPTVFDINSNPIAPRSF